MDERLLRAFATVARLGSFSKAGVALGYSQPAITHQVRQLEALLHVTLIDRDSVPMRLTSEGRARLLVVEAILGLIDGLRLGCGDARTPSVDVVQPMAPSEGVVRR